MEQKYLRRRVAAAVSGNVRNLEKMHQERVFENGKILGGQITSHQTARTSAENRVCLLRKEKAVVR